MKRIAPHAVVATSVFLRQARQAGISDDEMEAICDRIAADPESGDIIAGTGGARKLRHPGGGVGKRGGFRTVHYYGGDDVPIFLLGLYRKGQKADLSMAERNELSQLLPMIGAAYRRGVRESIGTNRRRK